MSTNNDTDKKSVAARLVAMAQERYLLGVSEDGEPFGANRARPHLAILLRAGKAGLRAELASLLRRDRHRRRRPGPHRRHPGP